MQFKEIVAPSMKELFINNIESMILSGELEVGEKLPSERELSAQMKISRTIVNLGLTELSKKGFIDIHPRQGAYVADYVQRGNLETLLAVANHNGGKLDKNTFKSICEFRITIEGRAYELAAQNRTQQDLEILFGLLQKVKTCKSLIQLTDNIFEFHHAVFCASKNVIFPLVHNGLSMTSKRVSSIVFDNSPPDFAVQGIEMLYLKIKEQDSDGAKNLIISLIRQGVEHMNNSYDNFI